MNREEREALIEKARLAYVEAWEAENARIENWDRDSRGKHTRSRAGIEAAFAVFEQAHTPSDDERELDAFQKIAGVLYRDKVDELAEVSQAHTPTDDEHPAVTAIRNMSIEQLRNELKRRRTAVQEPGEREAKIHGELVTMRVKEWRRITDELARLRTMEGQLEEPEPGKRLDPDFRADLVDAASHRITDAWADVPEGVDAETLAQNVVAAQEFLWIARGFPVAVQEPQGEPTDAQVLAALNAYYADYMIGPNKSLSEVRPPRTVHDMHAALRAAYSTSK